MEAENEERARGQGRQEIGYIRADRFCVLAVLAISVPRIRPRSPIFLSLFLGSSLVRAWINNSSII